MEEMLNTVRLIGITKPSESICHTADELIAYTARVSNPGNQNNPETAPKLLKYLIENDHWSPFEMVSATLEITTTRDISRQIIRHRSFSFQEFSQRYAVASDYETREARLQDSKNRQNSIPTDDVRLQESWNMQQMKVINASKEVYEWALENDIAKEQARAVLPEGNTLTTLYMAGNLRSWIHYCGLRRGNGTQLEHQQIADKCWNILSEHFRSIKLAVEDI
jgi:thymidylate synthase (FAD)